MAEVQEMQEHFPALAPDGLEQTPVQPRPSETEWNACRISVVT
jgi:hypothetical protein